MDACFSFAKNVVNLNYNELPAEVVEIAKRDILDTLGVAIAGSSEPGGEELMALAEECGGKAESTVIGFDTKLSAVFATLVNTTMAHALDYDDVAFSTGHIGVTVIPPAFAIAEKIGRVSGKELLTAIVLANDVACRLGEASKPLAQGPGWLYTPLYGIFGATTAAGKLLGFDEEKMRNAFGIAYSQTAGNRQPVAEGSLSKRMQAGFASKAGVFSALVASKGVTGPNDCFEGKFGLFNTYHRGEYNRDALVKDLGKHFLIVNLAFKKYPACTATEAAAEATVELIRENDIKPQDIEKVFAHVGEYSRNCCEPLDVKQQPRSVVDAQFSVPWVVASVLCKGSLAIEDMTSKAIGDPRIRDMALRVMPLVDIEVSKTAATFPARVEILMKNRTSYTRQIDIATGHPDKPMSMDEMIEKFIDCAKHGRKPIVDQTIEQIIEMVQNLESINDVSEIISLLG